VNNRPLTIFLSAAEPSGDHHAARLIRAIRQRAPQARLVGAAGPEMQAAGCEALEDLTSQAGMVGAPFLRLRYYYQATRRLQKAIRELRPDIHVPVDSPALNWHLAKAAKACGSKVVYYIAPQAWAWAPWRVKKLARLTDAVACILPFEEEYFRARGVNAWYVGHPLFDDTGEPPTELPDLADAWANGAWRVALVPGSRRGEIRGHCRAQLEMAREIRHLWGDSQCTFAVHDERAAEIVRQTCGDFGDTGIDIAVGRTREVLSRSHFGIIKSGTVTLEAAWWGVPMVIFYRTGLVMGALHSTLGRCRCLMSTRYLSLVNILAGRRLVSELMPWHGNMRRLRGEVFETMHDLGYLCELRKELMDLVRPLRMATPGGASARAADLILSTVGRNGAT
jgi:lipid-A-disaccharide synthase